MPLQYRHALYGGSSPDFRGTQAQLKLLGSDHLAWTSKRFVSPDHPPFSVVGARPFSQARTHIALHVQAAHAFDWHYGCMWPQSCLATHLTAACASIKDVFVQLFCIKPAQLTDRRKDQWARGPCARWAEGVKDRAAQVAHTIAWQVLYMMSSH